MSKNIVAIFDVDGVIIRGQSLLMLVRYLFITKRVTFLYFTSVFFWFLFFKAGLIKDVNIMRKRSLRVIKDWEMSEVEEMLKDFYQKELRLTLNNEILELLRNHQEKNHLVILASASITPLIKLIAKELKVNHQVSSPLIHLNGLYTGETGIIAYGDDKLILVKKLLDDLNVFPDLTYVYSDDYSDVPLLTFAEKAIVINPRSKLRNLATQRNWKIYDF